MWGKTVLMVAVRPSRHTFGIIESAADFTVSIPQKGMKEELMYCGTRSGRDCDKFVACALCTQDGLKTVSPVIKLAGLHYECKIIHTTKMDPSKVSQDIASCYKSGDMHTLYFGEILTCYETV
jgi:flavin reductase (DIM6/NTAB) family NADH-FMN oxidoreductase RutF